MRNDGFMLHDGFMVNNSLMSNKGLIVIYGRETVALALFHDPAGKVTHIFGYITLDYKSGNSLIRYLN